MRAAKISDHDETVGQAADGNREPGSVPVDLPGPAGACDALALALNATVNHTADTLVRARKDACAADPNAEPTLKDAEPLLKDEARAIALGVLLSVS